MTEIQIFLATLGIITTISGVIFKAHREDIKDLHLRIDSVEKDYMTCASCKIQHESLNTSLLDIKSTLSKIYDWILKQ